MSYFRRIADRALGASATPGAGATARAPDRNEAPADAPSDRSGGVTEVVEVVDASTPRSATSGTDSSPPSPPSPPRRAGAGQPPRPPAPTPVRPERNPDREAPAPDHDPDVELVGRGDEEPRTLDRREAFERALAWVARTPREREVTDTSGDTGSTAVHGAASERRGAGPPGPPSLEITAARALLSDDQERPPRDDGAGYDLAGPPSGDPGRARPATPGARTDMGTRTPAPPDRVGRDEPVAVSIGTVHVRVEAPAASAPPPPAASVADGRSTKPATPAPAVAPAPRLERYYLRP